VKGFQQKARRRLHKARAEHHRAYFSDWHNWFTNQCEGPAPMIGERLGDIHARATARGSRAKSKRSIATDAANFTVTYQPGQKRQRARRRLWRICGTIGNEGLNYLYPMRA
jgi:hypothetical protein